MTPLPVRVIPEPNNLVTKVSGNVTVTVAVAAGVVPLATQLLGVTVMLVKVRVGAAALVAATAAAGSFCKAITRTPSRAAWDTVV
jgi:hypothetical protein